MSEPKLTKKEKKAGAQAASDASSEDDGAPGFGGYLVGGVVGLLLLLVLWKGFASKDVNKVPDELPHLVVMAEFGDLSDPAVRGDLARLQAELAKVSDPAPEVLGPLSHKVLLSNPVDTEKPLAKSLDALTKEEYAAASPYFKVGGWLAPRIFNMSLTRACYRVGPTVGYRFAPGTRARVEAVLKSFAASTLKLRVYSHDLRFLDDEARKEINADFGVQTANSWGVLPAGTSCRAEPKLLLELQGAFEKVQHPKMRSQITLSNFWNYAFAVIAASPDYKFTEISEAQYKVIEPLQKACNADGLVSPNGERVLLFVTTSAEAKENVEIAHRVSGNTRVGDFMVTPFRPK
jgi:hypothetical protein